MPKDVVKKVTKELGAYLKRNLHTGTYSWDQVD